MLILKSRNLIIDKSTVRIVPISNSLNDIDNVKSMVRDVLRDDKLQNKILSIKGYLINDTEEEVVANNQVIKNIRCPFREIYRSIK